MVDGEDHAFYSRYNDLYELECAVIAYKGGIAVACGAMKAFDNDAMELKRMFTIEEERGKGHAVAVLTELENWTKELGMTRTLLETGKRLPAAVSMYTNNGYSQVENFGPYIGVDNSLCFEKRLV